jgi:hypothetical protein
MNLEQLANIAEVVGVLLVIASLIYVARQLRQTTEALHAQSRQSVLTSSQAELFALMNDPALAQSFSDGRELSPEENVRLHLYLSALVRAREFSWLQFMNGQIDETQWATELVVMQNILGTALTRRWWETMGRHTFGAEFVNFVDASIWDQPTTDEYWKTMQKWSAQHSERSA